jgi:thioredoxin-related protein
MRLLKFLAVFLASLAVTTALAANENNDVVIEEIRDFSRIARDSNDRRLPILLMFSAKYCSYCVRLEEEFLKPMLRSGDYGDKVLIRKMKIDGSGTVRDFDGKQIPVDEFTDRYNISVTPTVVFLDGSGAQLAPKRVGLSTPDFYGGYLDQSIDLALDVLRRNKPMRVKLSALEK